MKVSKKSALVAATVLATSMVGVHGRSHSALMFPRRAYNYHRRSPHIDLMSDMLSLPVYFNSLFQQQQEQTLRNAQSDPAYHVQELPNGMIELTMDVPGVAAADLSVELIEDGTMLHVSGSRRQHDSVTEFDKLFRLDKDVDAAKLSVKLSGGVLTVTAPKKEKVVKKLPIVVADDDVVEVEAQVISDTEDGEEAPEEVDGMTITTENK